MSIIGFIFSGEMAVFVVVDILVLVIIVLMLYGVDREYSIGVVFRDVVFNMFGVQCGFSGVNVGVVMSCVHI